MSLDAPQPSLPELFRSLNIAPDYKHALVALAEQVERNAAALEHEAEHEQMLARAAQAIPWPRHAQPKRDRHGMRLVAIGAIATAGAWAALRAAAAWALRSGVRRGVTAAAAVAVGGTAIVAAPDIAHSAHPVPAAVHEAPLLPAHLPRHHQRAHPPGEGAPALARARRRRPDHDPAAETRERPDAEPTPSPSPSPSISATPSPLPSITPTSGAGAIARGVLGTLPRLTWHDMPQGWPW